MSLTAGSHVPEAPTPIDIQQSRVHSQRENINTQADEIRIRVVLEDRGNGYICQPLTLPAAATGEDTMRKLRRMHRQRSKVSRFRKTCADTFFMRRDALFLVSASPVRVTLSFLVRD